MGINEKFDQLGIEGGAKTDHIKCSTTGTPRRANPCLRAEQVSIRKGDGAGEDDWLAASPVKFDRAVGPHQALALLDAIYSTEDFVFCSEKYDEDVLAVWRLRGQIEDGEPVPPYLIPNPMTGRIGLTTGGIRSFRCNNSVEKFRFAVAELDDGLSKEEQLAWWWGFTAAPVVALIDGGGKSIHAWLKVDCPNRAAWERNVKINLFVRILIPMGCYGLYKCASRLSRMPGHFREETKTWQRLLYLDPEGRGRRPAAEEVTS